MQHNYTRLASRKILEKCCRFSLGAHLVQFMRFLCSADRKIRKKISNQLTWKLTCLGGMERKREKLCERLTFKDLKWKLKKIGLIAARWGELENWSRFYSAHKNSANYPIEESKARFGNCLCAFLSLWRASWWVEIENENLCKKFSCRRRPLPTLNRQNQFTLKFLSL